MNHLAITKKTIPLTICYFTIIISMLSNFSLEQSYSQDIISNSYSRENLNEEFNIAVASDWGCDEDAKKTAENIQK